MTVLADDPRWVKFNDPSWVCPLCETTHNGIFDISYSCPDAWPQEGEPPTANSAALREGDVLTEDFCKIGKARYLRGRFPLKVDGADKTFGFALWVEVERPDYNAAVAAAKGGAAPSEAPFKGWLANQMIGAGGVASECAVQAQPEGKRPLIVVQDEEHLFHGLQRSGITFDMLLEMYAALGHDIRPHLGDA